MTDTMKAAWLGLVGVIIAAVIGAVVILIKSDDAESQDVDQNIGSDGVGIIHTGDGDVNLGK
ncbi:hypothetical protein P4B35_20805 [Pontiellaceae bacterium B12227]|nr:hypothetical protein [Pontiellaceae bacterium B12227]